MDTEVSYTSTAVIVAFSTAVARFEALQPGAAKAWLDEMLGETARRADAEGKGLEHSHFVGLVKQLRDRCVLGHVVPSADYGSHILKKNGKSKATAPAGSLPKAAAASVSPCKIVVFPSKLSIRELGESATAGTSKIEKDEIYKRLRELVESLVGGRSLDDVGIPCHDVVPWEVKGVTKFYYDILTFKNVPAGFGVFEFSAFLNEKPLSSYESTGLVHGPKAHPNGDFWARSFLLRDDEPFGVRMSLTNSGVEVLEGRKFFVHTGEGKMQELNQTEYMDWCSVNNIEYMGPVT